MKFTFWCYAPALLLIVLGLVFDPSHGQAPPVKAHLAYRAKHFTVVQNRPYTPGENLMGIGGLMLFPATGLVGLYWLVRVVRRATHDSDKGRIT
jgi:hypothetical protein